MSRWPTAPLGEVLALDLQAEVVDPTRTYEMVGVYSFGRGLFHREPAFGGSTSYRTFYRLSADHIVMSQLFGWEGALALSSEEFAGQYVSTQFPTFCCDATKLDRHFLGWVMRRPAFWEELGTRAKGMGDRRRTLNPAALLQSPIPLPPLAEQRRLVGRIEAVAAKAAEATRLITETDAALEELCRSILASSDNGLPVPTPMAELVRLREPDVAVQANEVYHFAGVYCFGGGVFQGQRKSGLEFKYPRLTRLRAGEFVYPKLMAWEGALAVVPPACDGLVVSTEFPVFEINQELVLPEVLDVYFRMPSVWPELSGASTGTNVRRRRLNPADFLKYRMPLPSRRTQVRLREVRRQADQIKRERTSTAAELAALLPAVLDRAFRGEL